MLVFDTWRHPHPTNSSQLVLIDEYKLPLLWQVILDGHSSVLTNCMGLFPYYETIPKNVRMKGWKQGMILLGTSLTATVLPFPTGSHREPHLILLWWLISSPWKADNESLSVRGLRLLLAATNHPISCRTRGAQGAMTTQMTGL